MMHCAKEKRITVNHKLELDKCVYSYINIRFKKTCLRVQVHIHAYISASMYALTHHHVSRNVKCIIWHYAHRPLGVSTAASVTAQLTAQLSARPECVFQVARGIPVGGAAG